MVLNDIWPLILLAFFWSLIILFFVLFIKSIFSCNFDWWEVFVHFVAILIFWWITWITWFIANDNETTTSATPIVSLERWSEIWWTFILWTWKIDQQNVYYSYLNVWEDRYKLITIRDVEFLEEWDHFPAIIKNTICTKPWLFYFCDREKYIMVPKNTITRHFYP